MPIEKEKNILTLQERNSEYQNHLSFQYDIKKKIRWNNINVVE